MFKKFTRCQVVLIHPLTSHVLVQAVLNQADNAGPTGVLLFIATYAVSCVFLIPASVLTLGAGALYGPVLGTAVVSASSTTGCVLAFLASRYLVRPFAEKQLAQQPLFESLQKRIPERGAKLVLLLRLTPVVPFGLLNYACGALLRTVHICSGSRVGCRSADSAGVARNTIGGQSR